MNINENELIKRYQECKDYRVVMHFISKYLDILKRVCYKEISKKFFNIPLEYDDLTTPIYFSLIKTLEKFDLNQKKYNFQQALHTNAISAVRKEALTYVTKKQSIINNATDIDSCISTKNQTALSFDPEREWISALELESILAPTKNLIQGSFDTRAKKLLKLKLNGYSIGEIAKKMNLTSKQVSNMFFYIKKKMQSVS